TRRSSDLPFGRRPDNISKPRLWDPAVEPLGGRRSKLDFFSMMTRSRLSLVVLNSHPFTADPMSNAALSPHPYISKNVEGATMFVIVLVLFIVCIGMPLSYSWRVARLDVPTKGAWLIHVADSSVLVALIFLVGRWDIAGYYMRFILMVVFLGAVLWSLRRHFSRPWIIVREQKGAIRQHWTTVTSLALFGGALCYVVYGLVPPPA